MKNTTTFTQYENKKCNKNGIEIYERSNNSSSHILHTDLSSGRNIQ